VAAKPKGGITRLRVGRLTKAHGLKGALKIELYTDEPERRFTPGATFSLQVPPESPWHGKTIELKELRWYNGHPVGFFVGVDDRTTAETLARAIMWVDQDDAEELDPDTWYDHQLIGLKAVVDGVEKGTITRVDHLPAQDLIVVDVNGADVLVPFVKAIVPTVDIAAGHVIMTPPTGLFDPDKAEIARREPGSAPAEPAANADSEATADASGESVADEPATVDPSGGESTAANSADGA